MADYSDKRSEFWKRCFGEALDYEAYLKSSPADDAEQWRAKDKEIPELTPEQKGRLQGHNRALNVLVLSGVW
jgi:hypothetical protein